MNTNTHPIELFIVLTLEMLEGFAWIINELTGGHKQPGRPETWAQTTATAPATTINQPTIDQIASLLFPTTQNEQWVDYVRTLTVKQLQQLTGITNSRYRKQQLIDIAIAY